MACGQKFTSWCRYILSCCDAGDEDYERPPLQIVGIRLGNVLEYLTDRFCGQSAPTDFRREDITIEGLTEEQ